MSTTRWLAALTLLALALLGLWLWRPEVPERALADIGADAASEPASVAADVGPLDLGARAEHDHGLVELDDGPLAPSEIDAPSSVATRVEARRPRADVDDDGITVTVLCVSGGPCRGALVYCEGGQSDGGRARPRLWSREKSSGADGRVRFARSELSPASFLVLRATAEPSAASPDHVIADLTELPSEVELQLGRVYTLDVEVQDLAGHGVPYAEIVLATTHDSHPIEREQAIALGADGRHGFRVPRGRYELRASRFTKFQETTSTVRVPDVSHVVLRLFPKADERPIAAAGVVLDEHGRGLPNLPMSVLKRGHSSFIPTGRGVSTGERGEFELRLPSGNDELEVSVGGVPLFVAYEPSAVRVPFGTRGLVFRRVRTWEPNAIRVHAVDAESHEAIGSLTFAMRLFGDGEGQRIYQGRDGWIDAQVPWRDDVAWKVDARGYFAVEGHASSLQTHLKDGVLELALERDPSELATVATERPSTIDDTMLRALMQPKDR